MKNRILPILFCCLFACCSLCSCGLMDSFIPQQECIHTETIDKAVAPSCTTDGLTEGRHCSVCGEVTVKQETVSALGHEELIDAYVAPTCTQPGQTEGKRCSRCNIVTVPSQLINALGHTEVIDEAVSATCTTNGLSTGTHCSVCKTVIVAQEVIPATHTYGEWEIVSNPDCFLFGEQKRVCTVAGCKNEDTRVMEKLKHSFVQNTETNLFYCQSCDARVFNGHLYAAFNVLENWYDAYKICDSLGGYLVTITSKEEQHLLNEIISANSGAVPNTTEYYYWCGALRNTSSSWKWSTKEEFKYTNWSSMEPDDHDTSKQFHIGLASDYLLSANSHAKIGQWEDVQHTGLFGFICEWELDMTDFEHSFNDWCITAEPNCFMDGSKYRQCYLCGTVENEVIPKLEHSFKFNEETNLSTCQFCNSAEYNGNIYTIFSVDLNWFDAYDYCNSIGGHLVTITSAEEQEFLNAYMIDLSFNSRAWIGGYNDGNEYRWVTDETFEYTNWGPGEPNNPDHQFFVSLNYSTLGEWVNDSLITNGLHYVICEFEARK